MLHDFGAHRSNTVRGESVADMKKALISRASRYSGLLDILDYSEAEAWVEADAWLAINADGSMRWGDGVSPGWHTVLSTQLSNKTSWDPSPLSKPGMVAMTTVAVGGSVVGDLASASLSTMASNPLVLTAHVSVNGSVAVLLRHVGGDESIAVEEGILRVLVTRLE